MTAAPQGFAPIRYSLHLPALMLKERLSEMATPVKTTNEKSCKVKGGAYTLEVGNTYLIKDRKIHAAMEMFKDLLEQNFPGLCITGTFPKKLRNQYGLGTVKFIWISTTEGKEAAYNPRRLDFEITDAVSEFVKSNKGCVVLLDGIELLVLSNGFEKVVEFVKLVNDLVAQHDSIFLLPVNPSAFEEYKLATMEQSLEVITIPETERQARIEAEMELRRREEEIEKLRMEIEAKNTENRLLEIELAKKEGERRKAQAELLIKEEMRLKSEYLLKIEEEERKRVDAELAMKEEERMKLELMARMALEEKKRLEEEVKLRMIAKEKNELEKLLKMERERIAAEIEKMMKEGHFIKCEKCKTHLTLADIEKFLASRPATEPDAAAIASAAKTVRQRPDENMTSEELRRIESQLEARKKLGLTHPFGAGTASSDIKKETTPTTGKKDEEPPKIPPPPPAPQHNCPHCDQKLIYFPQYSRWHCTKCNKWFAIRFDKDKK